MALPGLFGTAIGQDAQVAEGGRGSDPSRLPVKSKSIATPPGSPSIGDRYIIDAVAAGAWVGREDEIAEWAGAEWSFESPAVGWWTYVEDETEWYTWTGSAWVLDSFHEHAETHRSDGADGLTQFAAMKEPTGVRDAKTAVTLSWSDVTKILTITPTGASFDVWVADNLFVKIAADTKDVSGVIAEGLWYFYYDSAGVLQASQTPWTFGAGAPVAIIHWSVADASGILVAWELHGTTMDWRTHEYLHDTVGTRYEPPGLETSGTVVGDGSLDADAQVSITDGKVNDEDIEVDIHDGAGSGLFEQELSPIANVPVYYRSGAGGGWRKTAANAFPVKQGAARVQFNLDTAGTWSTPDATANGRFVAVWLFATTNMHEPVIVLIGQREDIALAAAQDNNQFGDFEFGTLPLVEMKVIARLIVQTSSVYSNTPHARLREILDLRTSFQQAAGTFVATDHQSLGARDFPGAHSARAIAFEALGVTALGTVGALWSATQSAGKITGGAVIDGGTGTVDVSAGEGVVKTSDSDIGDNMLFAWSGVTGLALVDDDTNYVYVDYNGGAPQVGVTNNPANLNGHTIVLLSPVYRKGTTVWISSVPLEAADTARKIQQKSHEIHGVTRVSGLVAAESGARYLTTTLGIAWAGIQQLIVGAFDTTGADTFDEWYRDGSGGWTRVVGSSQVNNQSYDDGDGGLGSLSPNRYGVRWIFVAPNGTDTLHMVYGRVANLSLAEAQTESLPTDLPGLFTSMAVLVARVIVKYNETNLEEVSVAFGSAFNLGAVSNHNQLSSLQGGAVGEYYHLASVEHTRRTAVKRLVGGDSPYIVLATDRVLFCDTDSGAITVNLLAGVAGRDYRVVNTGGSANDVTLDPTGTEQLRGGGAGVPATIADGGELWIHYESTEGWW